MEGLEAENRQLRKQNAQMDKDLKLAAEIGKQLLKNNQDLSKQLEDSAQEFTNRIEALEQDRHSLQLKLEHNAQMSRHRDEELENIKSQLESQKRDFEMKEQNEHLSVVNQLKKQLEQLRCEADQSQLLVTQLEEKIRGAEDWAESLRQELHAKVNSLNETCSEEMAQLHSEVASINSEKRELLSHLSDSKHEIEQLKLTVSSALSQLKAREAEVEEQQCQATSYYNALENCREEVQELKVQLDIARMDSQDQKKKGNSLFGEVEDRRVEAEKKMIALKVQNETLKKQYKMEKENVHKLKLQMSALLQMSTGRADTRHLERLHEQLEQARGEITSLTMKLKEAENSDSSKGANVAWQELLKTHFQDDYAEFVSAIIKKKDEEIAAIQAELSTQRLQQMAETQKVIEYQRRIYSLEQEVEKQIGLTMKQRVRIEELEIKYEPDKNRRSQKVKLKAEKIAIPEVAPVVENKENEQLPVKTDPEEEMIKIPSQLKVRREDVSTLQGPASEIKPAVIDRSALQSVRPVPAGKVKNGGEIKKVSISDEVDVHDITDSDQNDSQDQEMGSQRSARGRYKGGTYVAGRTVQVKAAQPAGEGEENCKVQ